MTTEVAQENTASNPEAAFEHFSNEFASARESGDEAPTLDGQTALADTDKDTGANAPDVTALQAELNRLQHKVLSDDGRVAAYQRKYEEANRQLRILEEAQKAGGQSAGDTKSRTQLLEQIADENPELAEPIKQLVDQVDQEVKRTRDELNQALTPIREREQQSVKQSVESYVESHHPDARQLIGSQDFLGWLSSQSNGMRALYNSADPDDAVSLLNTYKTARSIAPQRNEQQDRRERLNASSHMGNSRPVAETNGAPQGAEAAFDYYADQFAKNRGM